MPLIFDFPRESTVAGSLRIARVELLSIRAQADAVRVCHQPQSTDEEEAEIRRETMPMAVRGT